MDKRFDVDGKSYFIKVTPRDTNEAKKVHNSAFRKALEGGAFLRKALMNYMNEQGVWSEAKEKQYQNLIKQIHDIEFRLSSGKMKISEGRKLAIELAKVRGEFRSLIAERNDMEANTAEGQADNARFNFLVSRCVYDYDSQKPVYSSLDDYIDNSDSDLATQLATKFANYMYGVDENYDDSLVENKFLKRFNLIDESGRFIDKDGQFIDVEGNRLDADGYRLDAEGNRIDINGHRLDVSIDTAEFIED